MQTVTRPDGIPADPQAATPYFRRPATAAERVEELAVWYRGGLGPDPLAA